MRKDLVLVECKHLNIHRTQDSNGDWDYICMDCEIDMHICDDFDYTFHPYEDHRFDHDW